MTGNGWIGVDFDGTLATYNGWDGGRFGGPIIPMMQRVREWLDAGIEVRIVTARAADPAEAVRVQDWLVKNGLPRLAITDRKDYSMIELWDDRAVTVENNTGRDMRMRPNPDADKERT